MVEKVGGCHFPPQRRSLVELELLCEPSAPYVHAGAFDDAFAGRPEVARLRSGKCRYVKPPVDGSLSAGKVGVPQNVRTNRDTGGSRGIREINADRVIASPKRC